MLDHMVILFLVFQRTSILFSIAVELIYILTNNVEVFLFPHISPAFVVICVIDDSHFNWGEVEPQCHFDLHFLFGISSYVYWSFVSLLLRIICSVHLPIYLVGC
jgi:hypothetical protein